MKYNEIMPECFIDTTLVAYFNLPSNLDDLIKTTKNSVTTQNDPRILKLSKAMRQSPEVAKLQDVLAYLAANKYNVDIEELKKMIEAR